MLFIEVELPKCRGETKEHHKSIAVHTIKNFCQGYCNFWGVNSQQLMTVIEHDGNDEASRTTYTPEPYETFKNRLNQLLKNVL